MNKKTIGCIATAIAVAMTLNACGRNGEGDAPADPAAKAELHSGLLLDYMDTAVEPGDDFNAYVNGGWIDTATIPADKPGYGIGTILNDQSQEHVKAIIEQSAEGDFAKGSDEQKVGDLYQSYMNMETRNALGMSPLENEFDKIDSIKDYEELAVYFAEANKFGFNMPFALLQYVDFKNPNTYMMYTYQGGLGLPDREYYFTEDQRSEEIRQKYVAHVATMLDMAGIGNGEEAADTIMKLETRLAAEHMKKEQTRDMVALYNRIPTAELPQLMPSFNWDAFLAEAGIPDIDGLVVTQLDYMKALDGIITDTDLGTWKTFLKWAALNASAGLLTEELDRQNFEFYSKTLQGTEEPLPLWRRGVSAVNANLGEVVGKVYVKEHFPPEAKERMLELVSNLLKAYETSIRELDWMTDETKAQALDKLSKFTPKIGYPDIWKDYSTLEIEKDDLVGNLHRSALVVYQQQLEKQKGPVQKHEWQMTPQTVNAYYNPPLNEIVFPAAILQPPYFDLYAEDAVNYGAIGAVIGHEIGHGFDDSGSTFDGDGVLRNWWTDADAAEFKKRTAKLVEQYSSFKPYDDINVNGEFTLGENIGDL
ncbi:MAG TPA: M13 family metallopeptidase, partial [Woeseiaceae bacterium]|nr:M13 family metallopeptidase [Woeseiaceae bacterium]